MSITTEPVAGPRRRPSPTPVTEGETAHRTPHTVPPAPQATNSATRAGARARIDEPTVPTQGEVETGPALVERLREYWTPPVVWADPPASLSDLVRYAHDGEWTSQDGPVRLFGIGYSWLAVVASTLLYYTAWIVQRPGRLVTCLIVYALLAHTPFGAWLPWPEWL